jgi:hypothetical protein
MPFPQDEAEAIWQKLKQGADLSIGQILADTEWMRTMRVHSTAGLWQYLNFDKSKSRDAVLGLYTSDRYVDGRWGPWIQPG